MSMVQFTTALSPALAPVLSALHATGFSKPWDVAAFATLLASPGIFGCLALREGEPVGFCLCRAVLDEAELLTICTVPACRGSGVGKGMMAAILASCRDLQVKTMFLEVSVENNSAQELYRQHGFQVLSTRRGYYLEDAEKAPRRVDALVMSVALAETSEDE